MGVTSVVVSLCVWLHFSPDSDGKEFCRVHIRRAEEFEFDLSHGTVGPKACRTQFSCCLCILPRCQP